MPDDDSVLSSCPDCGGPLQGEDCHFCHPTHQTEAVKPRRPPAPEVLRKSSSSSRRRSSSSSTSRSTASTPADVDPLVGKLVADRFLVEAVIGKGAMGVVYRALQQPLERTVALKLLHVNTAADSLRAERFRREALASSRLNHPNVISVFDFGFWNGRHFLAMEYITGENLAAWIRRHVVIDLDDMQTILTQVCDALTAAHLAGVVHRDLKPANIMVTRMGDGLSIKLLDFGLAALLDLEGARLTKEGTTAGTPTHLSPEQCRGKMASAQSDLYSLGVIVYEMLCGQLPFADENVQETMLQHIFAPPDLPSTRTDQPVPPPLEALVMWMLSKDPSARPDDAATLRRELDHAFAEVRGEVEKSNQRARFMSNADRHLRADSVGLPTFNTLEPNSTEDTQALHVFVIEPSGQTFSTSLIGQLRANGHQPFSAESIATLVDDQSAQRADVIVVDARQNTQALLEEVASSIDEAGRCNGLPLVIVGPDDDLVPMTKALELGVAGYVPSSKLVSKLSSTVEKASRRAV